MLDKKYLATWYFLVSRDKAAMDNFRLSLSGLNQVAPKLKNSWDKT